MVANQKHPALIALRHPGRHRIKNIGAKLQGAERRRSVRHTLSGHLSSRIEARAQHLARLCQGVEFGHQLRLAHRAGGGFMQIQHIDMIGAERPQA